MPSVIVRQWLVLAMLPPAPRRIDTATIEARLHERGLRVHRRTIQRDLLQLSELFPIVADEQTKPYGWRWSTNDHGFFGQRTSSAPRTGPTLRVTFRGGRAARELLVRLGAPTAPSGLVLEASIDDSPEVRRVLLGHADDVEVLSPPSLRGELATRARRILERYET